MALTEEDQEKANDKELEETIKRVERERKKADKKERERKQKSELRAKMSVIASSGPAEGDGELMFDRKTLEKLKGVDIEQLEYSDEEEEGEKKGKRRKKKGEEEEEEEGDEDEEEEAKRLRKMGEEMDEYYRQ